MAELVREPLYQQLNEILRDLARSGEFQPGDRFLTERQVSERFRVSRPTANKVLAALVGEGLLEFRKGIGTFVCAPRLRYDLRALVSFNQKAQQAGRKPSTRVLRFETISASLEPGVGSILGVAADEPLFAIERLRLADGEPVILERRWVVAARCPDLNRRALHGSIYTFWKDRYNYRIADAGQTIRAINLARSDAALLKTRTSAAALLVTATGQTGEGEPLWFERTTYRGDAYEFYDHNPASGRLIAISR